MKLCIIVYLALIAIQNIKADVSHLQNKQYLPPSQQGQSTALDTALVNYQPNAPQQQQQQQQAPLRRILFGNVEIRRSVPIASYTIRNFVPAQPAHNTHFAAPAQAQTTHVGAYNYPTPVGGFQGSQPHAQQTYYFYAQPQYAPQFNGNQEIHSAPAFAPAPAAPIPTYNAQPPSYNGYPIFPPTQSQNSLQPQTGPQSKVQPTQQQHVEANNYDRVGTGRGVSYPIDLQQPNYAQQPFAQQPYSATATQQPASPQQSLDSVPTSAEVSVAAPSYSAAPAPQTYSTRDQASYSAPAQQDSSISQPISNKYLPSAVSVEQQQQQHQQQPQQQQVESSQPVAPPLNQEHHAITQQQQVSIQNSPPAFSQTNDPVSISQPPLIYQPGVQQNSNDGNGSGQSTTSQQDSRGYLPPAPQMQSAAQETVAQEQNQQSVSNTNQPSEQPSTNYQVAGAAASQPNNPAENVLQQQTNAGPAQATFAVPNQAQQNDLAPAQQSSYSANTPPPAELQSNSAPAPRPVLATSQHSHSSPELTQSYTPNSQSFPSPQSSVGSLSSPPPSAQHVNRVPAQLPQYSPTALSRAYLPPVLTQVGANQQFPTSTSTGSQIGQAPLPAAPLNQAYSPQAQTQNSQQFYTAPALAVGPPPNHATNTAPAQQIYSIPAPPSREYLPPHPPAQTNSDPSVPSYAAPAPQNAQSASIGQENYPTAGAQKQGPVVFEPQTSSGPSMSLPQTTLQSSTVQHSRNSQQNQLTINEAALSASSASNIPQSGASNSQNYGTVYGSNGGYVY